MRRFYVESAFGQLHVAEAGQVSAALLLGGAPRSGRQFDPLFPLLVPRFRLLAPDMPGFGNSTPAPSGARMEVIARSLLDVLDACRLERADIYGLHSGAKVAAALAAEAPDRVGRLVLAGKSHSLIPDHASRNAAMRAIVQRHYFADGAGLFEGPDAVRGWASAQRNLAAIAWDDLLFRAEDTGLALRAIEARMVDDILARRQVAGFYDANFAFDLAAALRRVVAPTLVLEITSPTEDEAIGRQGEALCRLLAQGSLTSLPEQEATGIFLLAGLAPTAALLTAFFSAQ
jgi:pimeloyl-ACP methyl ester carboxylesterase